MVLKKVLDWTDIASIFQVLYGWSSYVFRKVVLCRFRIHILLTFFKLCVANHLICIA